VQRARRRICRCKHDSISNTAGHFLAELRGGRHSAAQHGEDDDIPASPREFTADAVMRRRAGADRDADAGQLVKRDLGVKRHVADWLDIKIADVASVDLAPHRQSFLLGKGLRRDADWAGRFETRQGSFRG
jgi:hypothetical protein